MRAGAAPHLRASKQSAAGPPAHSFWDSTNEPGGRARLGQLLVAEEDEEGDAAVLCVRQPLAQVVLLLQPVRGASRGVRMETWAGLPLCHPRLVCPAQVSYHPHPARRHPRSAACCRRLAEHQGRAQDALRSCITLE